MDYWGYYEMFKQMGKDDITADKRANDLVERDVEWMLERKRQRESEGYEDEY